MAIRPRQAEMDALGVDPKMLSPMKEEVSVEEEVILPPAGELKEKFDEVMGVITPEGDYSETALMTIGQAINQALQLFGPDAMPIDPVVEEEGMLPVSIVKAIMMLNKAQEDAGLSQYIVNIEDLTNDRSLQQAAGKIMALAQNQTFKSFLAQLDQGFSQPEQSEKQPVSQAPQQISSPMEQMSEDELFMRRM